MGFEHVSLVYGLTGQVLEFYPPDVEVVTDGAPAAAANYRVFRGDQSNDETAEIATAAATLDSVATTVATTAAGYSQTNRRTITVASATGIAIATGNTRRRYVIANASGQREIITLSSVNGTSLTADRDLQYDYPITTSTFKGLRHYFTIDATFIATESKINAYSSPSFGREEITSTIAPPYRVEWQYSTAGSIARRSWTSFDVVRQQFKINLSFHDLKAIIPDAALEEWAGQRGQAFEPQITEACTMVEMDLRMADVDPDAVRDPQALKQLAKYAFCVVMARTGWAPPGYEGNAVQYRQDSETVYSATFLKLVSATQKIFVDTGTKGGINPSPVQQLFFTK